VGAVPAIVPARADDPALEAAAEAAGHAPASDRLVLSQHKPNA
jgi:hypothetical protein